VDNLVVENKALRAEVEYLRMLVKVNSCEMDIREIEKDIENIESELSEKRNELIDANSSLYRTRIELRKYETELDGLKYKSMTVVEEQRLNTPDEDTDSSDNGEPGPSKRPKY
jgi:chromosome segregation ATPase